MFELAGVEQVMKQFFTDEGGSIGREELASLLRQLDDAAWTEERVSSLLALLDFGADGRLPLGRFIRFLRGSSGDKEPGLSPMNACGRPADRPALLDMSAAAGQRHRPLASLPKAHLHLHLPAAMRRSTFEAAVREHLQPGGPLERLILDELDKRAKDDAERGQQQKVEQHQRRRTWLEESRCCYPKCLDSTDLGRFDQEMPRKELVWDIQFVTKWLLERIPEPGCSERLITQTVMDLAEDAAAEGIVHAELMTGFTPYAPGDAGGSAEASQKWATLFGARLQALAAHPALSLMFVAALPSACKTEAQAAEVLGLLEGVEGYEASAMAGVGYFCGEGRLEAYAGAFAECQRQGHRLVCVHAGEGEPSAGAGPERVRRAVAMGAERVGHGIEAAGEPSLMEELRKRRVCLEVCPLSNRALECCPCEGSTVPLIADLPAGLAQHPLVRLLAAGVECCLSADDPLYWAGPGDGAHGLLREYRACREIMGLDDASLARLADASLVHSSAPRAVVERARAGLRAWLRLREEDREEE